MADQPEKRAPRTVEVPMVIMSVPQSINLTADTNDWGDPVAHMQVSWPMTSMLIEIGAGAADAMIVRFNEIFAPVVADQKAGLQVVRDLPDHLKNGKRP
jgi:hypothetical protein